MGPCIKIGKRCTSSSSKIGSEDSLSEQEDLLCRVCRVVEYQFYHYGAYACNRCRAFFRRMVRRQRKGNPPTPCITTKAVPPPTDLPICDISLFRGACQACRFLACLNEGMNPSLVLTDEVRTSRYSRSNLGTPKQKIHLGANKKKTTPASANKKKIPKKEVISSVFSAPSSGVKFYYDSPVIIAPWTKDIQPPVVNREEKELIPETPRIVMNLMDEEGEEEDEEDPLVVDDADPIIGGGEIKGDRAFKETVLGVVSWSDSRDHGDPHDDNSNILSSDSSDQFSLEELYRFVDEEHHHHAVDYDVGQDMKPLIFDERERGLQTPTSSFEALNTPSYDPQLDNTVLNFSFSVPEIEGSSSLLVGMLEN